LTAAVADVPVTMVTPADRLGLTLCFAVILHAVVILGVTFEPEDLSKPRFETMEIILVQEQSAPPEEADLLAQANLEGGGDSQEKVTPATPLPPAFPEPIAQVTAPPAVSAQSPASPPPPAQVEPESAPAPAETVETLAATAPAEQKVVNKPPPEPPKPKPATTQPTLPPVAESRPEPDAPEPAESRPRTRELPSAATLLSNSFQIAALSAEIERKLEAKAQRPRRKFISASTKEFKYAAYMEAWRAKVERVGNLNYPDEARKRKLSGSLILDVALNADGTVNQITIRRSSGTQILDEAAARIVNLAAPFAPFPEDIRRETDILHITRTWQFLSDASFR
jgi:protein TonB